MKLYPIINAQKIEMKCRFLFMLSLVLSIPEPLSVSGPNNDCANGPGFEEDEVQN